MAGSVEKLSIALTSEMAAMVRAAVASGAYASTSEVIREALRGWQMQQGQRAAAVQKLRALIQEGMDSGPARYLDIEEIKHEARRRAGMLQ